MSSKKIAFIQFPGSNTENETINMLKKHGFEPFGHFWNDPPDMLKNYAGYIIENLGLKGLSIGDAQVSNIHSNYIINKNNASPENILSLINAVKDKVFTETGIMLENEVRIIDEK